MDSGRLALNIIERRNEARKWNRQNLWDELTTVWQAIKCKTPPVYKRDSAGRKTKEEDHSRTNVAMPDLNIIYRRNAARMTANPYRLRYSGGSQPVVTDMLSALAMKQYARSDEPKHDVRLVLATEAFGYAYTKLMWNTLERTMMFRRAFVRNGQVVLRSRKDVMRAQGAPDDEIDGAISQLGPDLSDEEVNQFLAKSGNEIRVPTDVKKYEGPIVKFVFNGDLFLEPGALTLDQSSFAIEQYRENDLWVKKMAKLTYEDSETGEEIHAFDKDALNELLATDGDSEVQIDELRNMFDAAVGRQNEQQYRFPTNLRPRKKFDILEQHAQDEDDGRMWITWVSEKYREKPLGRMPYPWDMYGKYVYTEQVPLPDLMSCFGDSTPRLLRHLYAMHNLTVAQNFDYITNLLKPFILKRAGVEVSPEVVVRGLFRELTVADLNGVKALNEPPLPNGSFERESQIIRMMQIAEPSITSVDGGTAGNPMAGKTATTALLSSKAADALTQFKFDGRNLYLRELGMKKLWMNQQAADADAPWQIEQKYWNEGLNTSVNQLQPPTAEQPHPEWAMSESNGKVTSVRLDVLDIQDDYEVEPEAGSYLAVDDELRQQAAQSLQQMAATIPGVIDPHKAARFYLSTIRGINNPDDYLLPPMPPQPPIKGNINVTVPLDKMPPDIVNQVLPLLGLQASQDLEESHTLDKAVKTGQAAEAIDSADSPGQVEQQQAGMQHEAAMQGAQQQHDAQQNLIQRAHEAHQATLAHSHDAIKQGLQHTHEHGMAGVTAATQAATDERKAKAQIAAVKARPKPTGKANGKPNGSGK
jgi:hypothetical protein